MVKSGLVFYFENILAPSELPANLPGQLGISGQIFLHWVAVNLKGLGEFQIIKNSRHIRDLFQKC